MSDESLEGLVYAHHVSEPTRSVILQAIRLGANQAIVELMLKDAHDQGHALARRFVSDRSRATANSPLVRERQFEF
jgi:hypothetical protein